MSASNGGDGYYGSIDFYKDHTSKTEAYAAALLDMLR